MGFVVPVVQEKHVIQKAMMAHRSAGMLEVPLEKAESHANDVPRNIERPEEVGFSQQEDAPQPNDQKCFTHHRCCQTYSTRHSRMMRKMSLPPQALRKSEHQGQITGI